MIRRLSAILTVGLLQGCLSTTVHLSDKPASVSVNEWQDFFIAGLLPLEQKVNVSEFCGKGEATKIQTKTNFGNALVASLTFGIYTPKKLIIWCTGDRG